MKCKDCEKYSGSKPLGQGLCTMPESWFPTKAENDCCYISVEELKCKDCSRFGNDFGCFGVDEDDSAEDCMCFIDIKKENVYDAFWDWFVRGTYSRENIMKLCDEFENSEEYRFFHNLKKKEKHDGE